ncbi:RNA polymerase sigma factor [Dysgonomonas sp. BGC7]|uniref:RNA polymerase sigma factor n=1 Tax=Dysgonomonas sp. BGC7 TaxID=1658008 RepID=UPI00068142F4|nr:RNA polymerase sigma factor [Dysgonomonas sp. BGC7]MBD8387485.1 RNA polymerase sigma factor [Dysgonomonas sp. BGC7]
MISFDYGIIEQCRRGERRAQMQLYNTFSKRVYNACYRVLQNSSEAEDSMQESFLKVFSKLNEYDEATPFEAWLVRIAINTSIDKLRKKDLDVINLNENIHFDTAEENDSDEWEYIINKVEQVKAAIKKLPETSRIILSLYLMEGYDHDEIAEILQTAPGTIRVQYMRAKQKLIELI